MSAGRRTVAIDFLGFGSSDKPEGAQYSFPQQLGDVEAVVAALGLDKVVPVGHDAGGPAAVNFALRHPERTAAVVLMNVFYGRARPARAGTDRVVLLQAARKARASFSDQPAAICLADRISARADAGDLHRARMARYRDLLGPLIDQNFRQQPSAAPAFAQMTSQLADEITSPITGALSNCAARWCHSCSSGAGTTRICTSLPPSCLRSQLRHGALHALEAGHWPQIDDAEETCTDHAGDVSGMRTVIRAGKWRRRMLRPAALC